MQSTPDDDYKEPKDRSIAQRYASFGITPKMPLVSGAEYLVHHLNSLGWYSSNGMGATPLTFTEIKSYIEITETALTADEVILIRQMSQNFVRWINEKNPQAKAPYTKK